MMNERLTDLALKTIAGQATNTERNELDLALNQDPSLQKEFEQLRASARIAKEVLPIAAALEATEGDFPAYARERLQTRVRQTFGRPGVRERKQPWAWKLFLVLAPVTVAVVMFLLIRTSPNAPIIQVAMLDTIGQTRGQGANELTLLQNRWKGSRVEVFSNPQELVPWERNWPTTKATIAKVVFDPAAAEVRVFVRSGKNETQKVIPIEQDLPAALEQAQVFISQKTRR